MKTYELALALSGTGLQAALCLALLIRGLQRRFPAFFAYNVFSVVSTTATLAARDHPTIYSDIYWLSEPIYVCLAFLTLHEAFRSVFRNFYHSRWFRWLLPAMGILIATVAAVRALMGPVRDLDRLAQIVVGTEILVRFLQVGIFALFLLLVRFFRMPWQQHAFGIVLGYGITASSTLTIFLLRSEFGTRFDAISRIASPVTYTLSLAVWLVTFLMREPGPPQPGVASGLTPEQMLSDLKRYTAVAKRIFRQ